jgi:hypothetical protein
MMWHIFKKDAKLLWWLAVAVAALRFAEVAAAQAAGMFPDARLRNLSALLSLGGILATGFAICAVVHQDCIPGVRQDWLVRPIRRRDLLLAKVLWAVLLIQLPSFAADAIQGLVAGLGAEPSLAAAASRSTFLLLGVDIPFLALASVTRNLLEALTACVVISLAFATFVSLMGGSQAQWQPIMSTGLAWLTESGLTLVAVAGSAVLLGMQYFRRRTVVSRYLMGVLTVVSILATVLPWQPAFAIQKSLAPAPGSAASIEVSFDPSLGRFKGYGGFPRSFVMEIPMQVFLPVRINGLAEDSAVQSDHSDIRVIDSNGRSHRLEFASRVNARRGAPNIARDTAYQAAGIPGDLYRAIKDQPVRVEIDYSLTLFQLASTHTLPAINGDERIASVGRCATRVNANGTAVQLSCEQAGLPRVAGSCISNTYRAGKPILKGSIASGRITALSSAGSLFRTAWCGSEGTCRFAIPTASRSIRWTLPSF